MAHPILRDQKELAFGKTFMKLNTVTNIETRWIEVNSFFYARLFWRSYNGMEDVPQ